ncbi:MAG TPA: HlyD family efflux transporter periplasmic adaptor subunit [Myxococcales bacterium]|jgi:HlyD family secretion protein|nr:HlyD family efflux transporter periplasmic adaptor subunit [Myxococcales bacterium]
MPAEIPRVEPRTSVVDIPRKPKNKRRRNLVVGGAIVLAVALVTFALSRLRAAAPVVDRAALWTDTVKKGPMLRDVKGPGTLVPEQIRLITADTAGRVERIPLRPGAQVEQGTVLMELSNPDVMLQALDAERQLAQAQADLINLRATTDGNTLTTRSGLATLEAQAADAERRAKADDKLAHDGVISGVEAQQQLEHAKELRDRLDLERKRLGVVAGSGKEQVAAQGAQIDRLKAVVAFRRKQVDSMKVRSVDKGVLSELPLELGQWVVPGQLLAKVVQPERLKAVLRIPETQARDLALHLPASIDTRNGVVQGQVSRISPAANQGSVEVDVSLPAELPRGARPDLTVEGTIEIERLKNVLYVGRPAGAQPNGQVELFKVINGDEAHRVKVKLGRSSVSTVEVLEGLAEGDAVILSDMSQWDTTDRVRLR